jgi:DNA-binding NtrC family response regulator
MHVIDCESAEAALVVLEHHREAVAFLFTDVSLAGEMSGVELANFAKRRFPDLPIIVTSGQLCRGLPTDAKFMRKPWRALDVLMEAERAKH